MYKLREDFRKNPAPYCKVFFDDDDLFNYNVQITGPEETPFEGGVFNLTMNLPPEFPFKPPKLTFLTPIFHPNISKGGYISLDILQDMWSPALLRFGSILISLVSFLSLPNPEDPIEPEIAIIYKNDKEEYNAIAREWTRLYATPQLFSSDRVSHI